MNLFYLLKCNFRCYKMIKKADTSGFFFFSFHKGQNKRYLNKKEKGKTSKLLSNGISYATKYAVSQPGLENVVVRESTSDMDECANYMGIVGMGSQLNGDDSDGGAVRTRPRTKNVSYHNMKTEHKSYDYATFSDVDLALQVMTDYMRVELPHTLEPAV